LMARGAEGRLFLVNIDRSKLSSAAFPFSLGDELIAIDGLPVNQVVDQIQATFTANVTETDRAQAELRLFSRRAARGMAVPKGPITLTVLRKGTTKPESVQLLWDYVPEMIPPRGDLMRGPRFGALPLFKGSKFNPEMSIMSEDESPAVPTAAENPFNLGTRQSFMPALGRKIWESPADNSFHAYLFQDENKKIVGYVRIPSYSPAAGTAKAAADFAAIIPHLEANAESLVIDQVNNPGGSVFYLYALVSMLNDESVLDRRR
ncbi:MAG: protease-like activity factor CPAF, partial [Proteobacteria bacterium]